MSTKYEGKESMKQVYEMVNDLKALDKGVNEMTNANGRAGGATTGWTYFDGRQGREEAAACGGLPDGGEGPNPLGGPDPDDDRDFDNSDPEEANYLRVLSGLEEDLAALESRPDDPELLFDIARAFYQCGWDDEALAYLDLAIGSAPEGMRIDAWVAFRNAVPGTPGSGQYLFASWNYFRRTRRAFYRQLLSPLVPPRAPSPGDTGHSRFGPREEN